MVERVARRQAQNGRFAADDRGQLLILTGVLMVLGFVIIGSTLVQLQAIEESTARTQRDALLDPVDALVASFNKTVQDSVVLGNTNITDFKAQMVKVEGQMRATATQGGMYLSAELQEDPDTDLFWRDSRCGAYIHAYTKEGVVIGYEKDTQKETIAGAVYDMHITDGRQSIRMPYYVRIYECMTMDMTSYFDDMTVTFGTESADWSNAETANDGLSSVVSEEQEGEVLIPQTAAATGVTQNRWSSEGNIVANGAGQAQHASSDSDDYLRWTFDPPAGFTSTETALAVTFRVDHWHTPLLIVNDIPKIKVTHGGNTLTWTPAVGTSETTYTWIPVTSPSGAQAWTYDEIVNSQWEYYIDEVLGKDPGRTWWVDYVQLSFNEVAVQGHQMDVEVQWPAIPAAYGTSTLSMRYQWTPGPTPDALSIIAWNYTTAAWDADPSGQYTFLDTSSEPDQHRTATLVLHETHHLGSSRAPKFRFVDSNPSDNDFPADLDSLSFDYLAIESVVSV